MADNKVSSDWKANYNLDKIDEAVEELKQHIAHVERVANTHTGVIMPVNNASFSNLIISNVQYYNSRNIDGEGNLKTFSYSSYIKERPLKDYARTVEVAKKHVEYWLEKARQIHDANAESITNNLAVVESIKLMMENLGIRETYKVHRYKTKRSRYKTEFTERAGWSSDVARCIPRSDGFRDFENQCKRQLERIEEWAKKQRASLYAQECEEKRKQSEQEQVMQRAVIIARYNVPSDLQDDDSLFEFLLNQDKYLKLAHKLLCIRNEFSYGYKYAKYAIDEFEATGDVDENIVADINECIDNWDGDGRVFRDTTWNYNAIFTLVKDAQLHADYLTMCELTLNTY